MFDDAPSSEGHALGGGAWLADVSPSYVPRGQRKRRVSDSMSDDGGLGHDSDDACGGTGTGDGDNVIDGHGDRSMARERSVRPRYDGAWRGGGGALFGQVVDDSGSRNAFGIDEGMAPNAAHGDAAVASDHGALSQHHSFRSLLNQLHHERALRSPRAQRRLPTERQQT